MTSTKAKDSRGRPLEEVKRLRDYRGNLLLDDLEEAVFKRVLRELTKTEGRSVKGAELVRRLVIPFLHAQAQKYRMKISPPKPTDLVSMGEFKFSGNGLGANLGPTIEPEDLPPTSDGHDDDQA